MTTLTILTIEKGLIEGIADFRSLLVPFAQEGLKGRSERLTNSSCIQPEEEDLSVVKELLDEDLDEDQDGHGGSLHRGKRCRAEARGRNC